MLLNIAKDLVCDTTGATAIEYGLILSLIAIAIIASLQDVANTTTAMWERVKNESVGAMTSS